MKRSCKTFFRNLSQDWSVNEIKNQMNESIPTHETKVDVRISALKPLHAI